MTRAILVNRSLFARLTSSWLATVEADAEFEYAVVDGLWLATPVLLDDEQVAA